MKMRLISTQRAAWSRLSDFGTARPKDGHTIAPDDWAWARHDLKIQHINYWSLGPTGTST